MRVALVSMPFVAVDSPSVQIGLLKAVAAGAGFRVTNFHLYLDFARQIGIERYSRLAEHRGRLFGDWIFAALAFPEQLPRLSDRFLLDFEAETNALLGEVSANPSRCLRVLREREVLTFLDRIMDAVPWGEFRVVGFTSCFQQNVASFALARRIKARYPDVCTVFGGANFDGEMGVELVRSVDSIDYAIAGEGDESFTEFLFSILEDHDPAGIPGVICRRNQDVAATPPRPPLTALDNLPYPNYDDYFECAESLGLLNKTARRNIGIPFESSRGCWWGQKHHCTFCGLNASGMAFRGKSAQRVFDELAYLSLRYRTFRFDAVDNILSMGHLHEFLPRLVENGVHYTLFYETKANLKREHLALFRRAGVRAIQPGLESLSSHVLELMRKGVTAIQNVNLLRWALYYRIRVVWNLIWGFPGESEEDYKLQACLIPRLIHLQPPLSTSRIWMERFSPVYFDRDRFPVRTLEPERSYSYVYPEYVDLKKIAYFFDYEFRDTLPDSIYSGVETGVREWRQAWTGAERPRLTFRSSPGFLRVEDRRYGQSAAVYSFTGPIAALYAQASDGPQSAAMLAGHAGATWPEPKVEDALNQLCTEGLMMRDGNQYLSLAIPDDLDEDACSEALFR